LAIFCFWPNFLALIRPALIWPAFKYLANKGRHGMAVKHGHTIMLL